MVPSLEKCWLETTIDTGKAIVVNCLDNYTATNYKKKS